MSNTYRRSTKTYLSKREQEYALKEYFRNKLIEEIEKKEEKNKKLLTEETKERIIPARARLLDSSLNIATKRKSYMIKIIRVGEYIQAYYYNKLKMIDDKNLEPNIKIDNDYLFKKQNFYRKSELKVIQYKNIMRSKFKLQRLVKANEDKFKTFITLTFAENVTDLEYANKKFATWRTKIQSIKKDFLYVCVPEFQKRGAVHYHLLTNLDIKENPDIIIPQTNFTEKQLETMSEEERAHCYDVKYWSYGFTRVDDLTTLTDNVVGYISKYMTKNIDNRLFGRNRYLSSRNGLIFPEEVYLNPNEDQDFYILLDIVNNYEQKYTNKYLDIDGDVIDFIEYKKIA